MRPTHGIDKSEYTNQPPGQSVKPILPEHQAAPLIQMQGLEEDLLGNQMVSVVTDEVLYTGLLEMQESEATEE